MTFLKLRVYIIKPKKNMIEERSYGKSELAMLYFPNSDPSAALKRLNRWIDNISELKLCLAECHTKKKAKYWSHKQVILITYYLGEP